MAELPESEYELMYSAEDSFWWYRGMREITSALFTRLDICEKGERQILDAGCGTGGNLEFLSRYGDAFGTELSGKALGYLALRGARDAVRSDVAALPFKDESFDLVCSFDVLEYIPEDALALNEMFRVLRAGGLVLIRDAAFSWLYGEHDRSSGIQRRYTASSLNSSLSRAGFDPVYTTYANFFLFPAIAGVRLFREHLIPVRGIPRSDILRSPWFLDSFLGKVMGLEAFLCKTFRLPFGISVVAAGKKPG